MPTNFSRTSENNIPLKYVQQHSISFMRTRGQTDEWDFSIRALWGCKQAQKDTNTHTDI